MKVIVADDEKLQLSKLERCVNKVLPDAEVFAFSEPKKIIGFIETGEAANVDVAFLDISMGPVTGMQVAKKLQSVNPKINIVFVTGYTDYAPAAFNMRASGYIVKPVTEEAVKLEIENLRNPMPKPESKKAVKVRCFGSFEATVNGEPLKFKREKTKEFLAYLVDRNGAACTPREICAVLWEEDKFDYLRQLTKDLRETLKAVGAEGVFITHFKEYRIVPELIECDYYDYLANEPYAVKAFNGEYMVQYSWAEETLARILQENR